MLRSGFAALAAALALAAPAAAVTSTTAAYYGDHVHDGCTWPGCTFSATSTTCESVWSGTHFPWACSVTVSGFVPDADLDVITNAALTYTDAAGSFTIPVTYDGVTYRGRGVARGQVVVAAGTVTFSLPSGDLDPPPTRVTLTGGLQHVA